MLYPNIFYYNNPLFMDLYYVYIYLSTAYPVTWTGLIISIDSISTAGAWMFTVAQSEFVQISAENSFVRHKPIHAYTHSYIMHIRECVFSVACMHEGYTLFVWCENVQPESTQGVQLHMHRSSDKASNVSASTWYTGVICPGIDNHSFHTLLPGRNHWSVEH